MLLAMVMLLRLLVAIFALHAIAGRTNSTPGSCSCAADALRLPFGDHSFDAAMIAYGWRNVDDPALALQELKRVVRPGGQVLILEFFGRKTLGHIPFTRPLAESCSPLLAVSLPEMPVPTVIYGLVSTALSPPNRLVHYLSRLALLSTNGNPILVVSHAVCARVLSTSQSKHYPSADATDFLVR